MGGVSRGRRAARWRWALVLGWLLLGLAQPVVCPAAQPVEICAVVVGAADQPGNLIRVVEDVDAVILRGGAIVWERLPDSGLAEPVTLVPDARYVRGQLCPPAVPNVADVRLVDFRQGTVLSGAALALAPGAGADGDGGAAGGRAAPAPAGEAMMVMAALGGAISGRGGRSCCRSSSR